MRRFNLLRHGEILKTVLSHVLFESDFFPFVFVDGKPDIDDVLEFCGDVFSDNGLVGSDIASVTELNRNCHIADVYCEVHTL